MIQPPHAQLPCNRRLLRTSILQPTVVCIVTVLMHSCLQQAATEISKIHDGVDILINNAGIDEGIHPISEL